MSFEHSNQSLGFGEKLDEAFNRIKIRDKRTLTSIRDEIGDKIGRSGRTLENWGDGQIPPSDDLIEDLARAIHAEIGKELGREWFETFLF